MVRGVVKWFNFEKGFGFIEITSGKEAGSDIFCHASDIEGNPLRDDDQVEFDIDDDNRAGKPRATKVTGGTGRREDMMSKGKGKGKDGMKGGKPGDWECDQCGILNFASRTRCFKCDVEKSSRAYTISGRDDRGGGYDDRGRDDRGRGGKDDRRDDRGRDGGYGGKGSRRDDSRGREKARGRMSSRSRSRGRGGH